MSWVMGWRPCVGDNRDIFARRCVGYAAMGATRDKGMAMYSHVTVGTSDMAGAGAFYDAVLATLGTTSFTEGKHHSGYGEARSAQFWVLSPFDRQPATSGNGTHVAFLAPDRASVDAFYAAAMANGATDEGAPGLRPHYHPSYYGAYVRDADGNKIQAVCHDPEG